MDEWAYQRVRGRRVTDRQLAIGADDACHHIVSHRAVHDQPAQAGAALTCGAGRGEHDAAHRQLQVGRRRHNGRVVAAQLQQHPPEAPGDAWTDLLAHPHRTRRRQQRNPRVVDELRTTLGAAQQQAAHRGRRADISGGPTEQRLAGQRRQRRQLRGFPHHRVAADQCHRGVPRPDRDREVERGDHAHHSQRMPGFQEPVPSAL
ncbi:Uncharacterised protein [Mycobacterium tuberculosis]|nr:Uncharacterised protein [Mycobacterium tuberculosis]